MTSRPDDNLRRWLDLIPLYLNGSLKGLKREAFEQALQKHPELRRELALFHDVQSSWQSRESNADFGALFARIKPAVYESETVADAGRTGKNTFPTRIVELFSAPQLAWGVALAQLCLITVFLGVQIGGKKESGYQTLTGDGTTQAQVSLNVVFADDARLQQISSLLRDVNARIIDGPTAAGRVTVGLIESNNEARSVEERIALIRKSGIVVLAEPGS